MKKQFSMMLAVLLTLCGTFTLAENAADITEVPIPVYMEMDRDAYKKINVDIFTLPAPENAKLDTKNTYPYLGLSFDMPQSLLDRIEANEVFLFDTSMFTVPFDFHYIPEAARHRTPHAYPENDDSITLNSDFYVWFQEETEPLAQISTFPDVLLEGVDPAIATGYPHNEVLAKHGGHTLMYSTVEEADLSEGAKAILPELETVKASLNLSDIRPYDESFVGYNNPPLSAPGDATAFATQDVYGEPVTPEVFAEKKLTLINIWSSWCGPCVTEMPYLNELHEEMADQGVQVIGILYDGIDAKSYAQNEESIEAAQAILEELGINYRCILPDSVLMEGILSEMQVYPTSFFVDEKGNNVGGGVLGMRNKAEWKTIIEKRLAEIGG